MKEKYYIHYSLEYDIFKKHWIVFKNVDSEHSMGFIGVFSGTRKDCLKYIKENKIKIEK